MQPEATPGRGLAVWFTGLSGAGKTTLCRTLEPLLCGMGYPVHVLDADEIRQQISADLGYSKADRDENIRRIGELAHTLVERNFIVLVAAISPYREARLLARQRIGSFLEVYVNAPLAVCIERDPKHLYARALKGELRHFTGIEDPYEPPLEPNVECQTGIESREQSAAKVLAAIRQMQQGRLLPDGGDSSLYAASESASVDPLSPRT